MAALTTINIAGKEYPLNFSLQASREVTKRCGGYDKLGELSGKGNDEYVETVIWMLTLLINEGFRYRHFVENAELERISEDELGTVLSLSEMTNVAAKLMSVLADLREIRTVDKKGNAQTT